MLRIGQRNINPFKVIFDPRHYIAAFNTLRLCQHPFSFFASYFLGKGSFPCAIELLTPVGLVAPSIYSYNDSLTVNEIFFRLDYKSSGDIKTVVDIGTNIGISAMYFLTRNHDTVVYAFEPVAENIAKLQANLKNFSNRIIIDERAVYTTSGRRTFGTETLGRCGGLHRESDLHIEVDCVSINEVLESILAERENIDVLKIDIEGDEIEVVRAINPKYLSKIKTLFFEIDYSVTLAPDFVIFPEYFQQRRYGNTYILTN